MLDIDYSLIPITELERGTVEEEVARRLADGEAPHLDRSHHGRVVVLNPDPVHMEHHIPQELRSHLRRTVINTSQGPHNLPAERLLKEILESDEPLKILVIELKSRFVHLGAFMDGLGRIRRRFPEAAVFFCAELPDALARLQELIGEGERVLRLSYADARGAIEIRDPGELSQVAAEQVEPLTFSFPFFSQIRIATEEGRKPEVFNLDSLRALHHRFGHGAARELELGSGRRDRVIVLDIPIRLIKGFQFRQDRGLDFYGVLREGRRILSRNFEKQKLEYRWIPMESIEGFLRMEPGEEVETALVADASVLRINTFNGNTSFIASQMADQISLDDVAAISLRSKGRPAGGDGLAADAEIRIDKLVLTGSESGLDIQDAIRTHVFSHRFREEAERAIKLESYAGRLNVGAVGPLAAQTLKIFRRHGLERLIAPDSFHYLCGTSGELTTYHQTPQRLDEAYSGLLSTLRGLLDGQEGSRVRIQDVLHRLPLLTEWLDAPERPFQEMPGQEFRAAHKELELLIRFVGDEFKRNFEVGEAEIELFHRIADVRAVSLNARWLGDVAQGAYGTLLEPGQHPDVVFFGTQEEKADNDREHHFPAIACAELLPDGDAKRLLEQADHEFSVFLEEETALADHHYRQEGQVYVGPKEYAAYFDGRIREVERELEELRRDVAAIDSVDSPEYRQMLDAEENAFYDRQREFIEEHDTVHTSLQAAIEEFHEAAAALRSQLPSLPAVGAEAGHDPAFDHACIAAAEAELSGREEGLHDALVTVVGTLMDGVGGVRSDLEQLRKCHHTFETWGRANDLAHLAAQHEDLRQRAPKRAQALRRMAPEERQGFARKVEVQLVHNGEEMRKLRARAALLRKSNQRSLSSIGVVVGRVAEELLGLAHHKDGGSPTARRGRVAAYVRRMAKVFGSMEALVAKVASGMEQLERSHARERKLATHLGALHVERELLRAAAAGTTPDMPHPPKPPPGTGAPEDPHPRYAAERQRLAALGEAVRGLLSRLPDAMREVEGALAEYTALVGRKVRLQTLAARKGRLAASIVHLGERKELMEAELVDLPERVKLRFMPARKELLLQVFIPRVEQRILNFRRLKEFLSGFGGLDHDRVKALYLDRAIFRRFSSAQFRRGLYVAMDSTRPEVKALRNVLPAVNLYFDTLLHNFGKSHPDMAPRVKSKHLIHMGRAELLNFIQDGEESPEAFPYDFIVLPATMPLAETVEVMNRKDALFKGLPKLVLVYVSKFRTARIQEDPELREAFFRAIKHNVIINIDGHAVVDNPAAIAHRILTETLGSTHDTDAVEEIPDQEDQLRNVRVVNG